MKLVDRPATGSRGSASISEEHFQELLATEENGRAVEFELPVGTNFINWQSNIRAKLSRMDPPKKLRAKQDKTSKRVVAWVESRENGDDENGKESLMKELMGDALPTK